MSKRKILLWLKALPIRERNLRRLWARWQGRTLGLPWDSDVMRRRDYGLPRLGNKRGMRFQNLGRFRLRDSDWRKRFYIDPSWRNGFGRRNGHGKIRGWRRFRG